MSKQFTEPTKEQLEVLWQGQARFARQCAADYQATVKEYGKTSSVAVSAWKRFREAENNAREAERAWQAAS